jgi:hypothetical protein
MRVFENRVLREIFGPKNKGVIGDGEDYKMRSFTICTAHPIFSGVHIKKNEMVGVCITYGGEERCVHDFGWETGGKETTWETQA